MIIDVRDYTVKPEARRRFVDRCENILFPEQERLGAVIMGMFTDADFDDRVVWLRAMPDLASRERILTDFYTNGEMWKAHKDEVNGWIIDSANVLMMHTASDWAGPSLGGSVVSMYSNVRGGAATTTAPDPNVTASIQSAGGRPLITLEVDAAPNNYPRHPIRTGVCGHVWFASFDPRRYRSLGLPGIAERRLLPTATSRMR